MSGPIGSNPAIDAGQQAAAAAAAVRATPAAPATVPDTGPSTPPTPAAPDKANVRARGSAPVANLFQEVGRTLRDHAVAVDRVVTSTITAISEALPLPPALVPLRDSVNNLRQEVHSAALGNANRDSLKAAAQAVRGAAREAGKAVQDATPMPPPVRQNLEKMQERIEQLFEKAEPIYIDSPIEPPLGDFPLPDPNSPTRLA